MKYTIIQDIESFNIFYNSFDFNIFSFDIEATGLDLHGDKTVGISFYDGNGRAYYIPTFHRNEKCMDLQFLFDKLNTKFINAEEVIAHNIKFDLGMLREGIDYSNVNMFCTMIASYLIDENSRHGLKILAKKYLGEEETSTFTELFKSYKDASYVPIEKMYKYACDDSIWAFKLYKIFKKKLEEEELTKYAEMLEMPFIKCIIDTETFGVRIDTELLFHYKNVVNDRIELLKGMILTELKVEYQMTLTGEKFSTFSIDSTHQLGRKLFKDKGYKPILRTETGLPKCNMEQFELLYKENNEDLFLRLIEYKKLKKLFSSYLLPYIDKLKGNRLYPSIIQHRTVTGRLSSASPNIQQLPRPKTYNVDGEDIEIRKLFLPDEGYFMIAGDYKGEELRIAASLAKDKNMLEAFNKGFDLHLAAANMAFDLGLSDAELTEGTEGYDIAKKKYKKDRQNAKAVSFGLLYGKGPKGFAESLGISEKEAQKIVDDYFKGYPGVKRAIDETHNQVRRQGYVKDMFGRRRRFIKGKWGNYPSRTYRQSFNFKIQSTAASLLKFLCIKIRRDLPEARILFTVHDEVVIQSKTDILKKLQNIMESLVKLPVRLEADLNIGKSYYEVK